MKRHYLILFAMLMFLNMTSQVTLGSVLLKHVSNFEISENILELSNTAKITIPKNYGKIGQQPILELVKVGDPVVIECGYDGTLSREFVGYIREIESDVPLVMHCDDETYPLRQTNYIKSYKSATLKQVLTDIVPKTIAFECPDVHLGKYQIDNASAFAVLQDLVTSYGLYSRLQDGKLKVGLAYDFGEKTTEHTYTIGVNVRQNDLKYKRKEDYKIRFKAISNNPNGKKTEVVVGNKEKDASERTLNFAGPLTEAQLRERALSVMAKLVYDGYTGSIKGFGTPRTHAGDSLVIKDKFEPERAGKYLIEKVDIVYNDSEGFSRTNTLSYKIG